MTRNNAQKQKENTLQPRPKPLAVPSNVTVGAMTAADHGIGRRAGPTLACIHLEVGPRARAISAATAAFGGRPSIRCQMATPSEIQRKCLTNWGTRTRRYWPRRSVSKEKDIAKTMPRRREGWCARIRGSVFVVGARLPARLGGGGRAATPLNLDVATGAWFGSGGQW